MTARLASRLGATPSPGSMGAGGPHRDSYVESAQQADDIFTLYGGRDSWTGTERVSAAPSPVGRGYHPGGPEYDDRMEELGDESYHNGGGGGAQSPYEVFSTPQEFGPDAGDYMHASSSGIDYSARSGSVLDFTRPYSRAESVAGASDIGRAISTAPEVEEFYTPMLGSSPAFQSRQNSAGTERRPSGQESVGSGSGRRPSAHGSLGEGMAQRRPSGQVSPARSFERRPSGQDSPARSFERRPSGQSSHDDGMGRRPSNQSLVVGEAGRRPSGGISPIGSFTRRPSDREVPVDAFARRPSGQNSSANGSVRQLSDHELPVGAYARRPSGQESLTNGLRRRPSEQEMANDPFALHSSAPESTIARQQSGQDLPSQSFERRPSGSDSPARQRSGHDSPVGPHTPGQNSPSPMNGSLQHPSEHDSPAGQPSGPVSAVPPHMRTPVSPDRDTLSPPSSGGNSPIHPSIKRIHNTSRNVSGKSTLTDSPGNSTLGESNCSLASSRYPGEDLEAFHVRSTYARLEVEGVYGDGWDEGIERTRGGMSQQGGRVTMMFPDPDGGLLEQEQKFIANLDRYGFVKTPAQARSEGRLALVPASPFSKVPKVRVRSSLGGSKTKKANASPAKGEPPGPALPSSNSPSAATVNRQREKEGERVNKWMRMMSVAKRDAGHNAVGWRWSSDEGPKHRTRIYKGIPDRWRMAAWWTLAEERAKTGSRVPSHESLEADFQSRRDQASENDVQIDLDVPRTISGHVLFRTRFGHGQRALFHVLHSFSQSCFTCGYCQGMGSVAATLLCYFEPERAYTLMVRLHDQYDMHGIFAPGFPGLLESFYVQERLMEAIMPDVYESFQRNMISSSAWGAKIYITLFVNVVPFNTQLRIWDALWLDGYDVMVIAVLALLWAFRPLLAHPAANFESILSLLSSYYVVEDEDAMLEWMRKMLWQPGVKQLIAHWRREWKSLAERGKTDGLLL